jgi:hypothetical protein
MFSRLSLGRSIRSDSASAARVSGAGAGRVALMAVEARKARAGDVALDRVASEALTGADCPEARMAGANHHHHHHNHHLR